MSEPAYCPHCGAPRPAWSRYCGACGRAVDLPPSDESAPGTLPVGPRASGIPAAAAGAAQSSVAQRPEPAGLMGSAIHRVGSSGLLSIMAVVVALALVAVVLLTRGTVPSASVGDPGIATADLPPVGEIRFGAGFDSTTFALSGASHEVRVGSTIAAVAHLSRPVGSNQAEVRIQLDGSVIAANPLLLAGMSQRDVAGWTFATPVAGEYAVSVIDQDGSTLATGRFTAR